MIRRCVAWLWATFAWPLTLLAVVAVGLLVVVWWQWDAIYHP